jgi:predicted acylesterase/phospholipase RssA
VPVLITAYDLQAREALLLREGVSMVDAAHAAAAPTYFEPVKLGERTLVDGGVFAVNPAVFAYAEAGGAPELLLSLGTGEHTRPLPYETVRDWGKLEWAEPIIDVVFDGGAGAVDMQLQKLVDGAYLRLQTRLEEASDALDDASEDNLAALQARGGAPDRRDEARTSTAPARS